MPYHNGPPGPPDINAILRTLAQSHSGASSAAGPSTASQNTAPAAAEDDDEYDPTQFMPEAIASDSVPTSKPSADAASENVAVPSRPDPSTIITWAPALRYVTALIARDNGVVPHLQKLRRSQTEHETQWWQGRQALVDLQANRGSGRKQIEAILRGVGGNVDPNVQGQSPEDDAAELKHYDAKVYRALTQMHDAMSREFKNMGVPFFCTQPALIEEPTNVKAGNPAGSQEDQTRLSQEDLRRLQSRMLETLEDLSGV